MGEGVLAGEALPGGGIVWLLKRISGVDGRRRGTEDRPGRARPVLLRSAPAGLLGLEPHLDDRLVELRSEEHTSELQSLMRISYAVFCLKKKNTRTRREYDSI